MSSPDPFTPPECDLRGSKYMPLFGAQLFSSDLYATASDAEFRTAVKLWWASWIQVPAGSLPNNEQALAMLADYGRDMKGWAKVRTAALRGFILCSDGRLYHPLLCEAALDAFDQRFKRDTKRAADRERLKQWRETRKQRQSGGGNSNGDTQDADETPPETVDETRFTNTDETALKQQSSAVIREEKSTIPSGIDAGAPKPPPDAKSRLWVEGIPALRRMTGKPDGPTRSLLGQLLKNLNGDCAKLLLLLQQAERDEYADPAAWLTAATLPNRESPAERRIRETREAMHRMTYPELYEESEPFVDHEPQPQPQPQRFLI